MITSTSNPRIKQLVQWQNKAKERRKDGVFVAEGFKMLEEAPSRLIREIYLTKEASAHLEKGKTEKERLLFNKISEAGFETVADEVLKRAADTQTPQGVMTVLDQPVYEQEKVLSAENGLYLLLEDIQDPGNLGTILRTGEGAGVTGVIITKNSVDLFNPKTIRATMGSVYRVPFLYVEGLESILREMHRRGITTFAAHLQGERAYDSFSFRGGTAFLIGNEGNGLKKETAALADYYLKIPMEGKVESLNAAVSASILMYEAYRQRRKI